MRKRKDEKSQNTSQPGQQAVIFSSVPAENANYKKKAGLLIGVPVGAAILAPLIGSFMALSGNPDAVRVVGNILLGLAGPLLFLGAPIGIVLGCFTLVNKR